MSNEQYIENDGNGTMEAEEYSIEDSEEMEEINFDTEVDTKLENIRNMFAAAELKRTELSRHYIVRDSMDEFYYLKVSIYENYAEFAYCLQYFQSLMTFTQQLAQTKKDVLRILNVSRILLSGPEIRREELLRGDCHLRLRRVRLHRH